MTRRKEVMAVIIGGVLLLAAAVSGTISHARPDRRTGAMAMAGNLHVEQAWARINPVTGRPSSAYVTIHNMGMTADALIAASTPIAERAELHNHVMDGTVMKMDKVPEIMLAPGTATLLSPGGTHLMLFGMKKLPKPGTKVPLTLTFKSGGTLTLVMVTQGLTADGPGGAAAEAHSHH